MKTQYRRKHMYDNLDKDAVQKEIEYRDKPRKIEMTAPQVQSPKRKYKFNLE